MAFGLMGGSQQAQGHAQVLVDMIDLGANPQAASDAARFTHAQASNTLYLESNLYDLVGAPLSAMGHQVKSANGEDMGGFQAIWFHPYPARRPHPATLRGTTHRGRVPCRLRSPQGWRGSGLVIPTGGGRFGD